MATDVRHVNISDTEGKVFCYKVYSIVELDGPHLSDQCWVCPFWAGLAGGYGVECMYEDDKVMNDVETVKFRNPEDAKDHAPKKASNLDSAASKFGVKANDARAELIGKEKIEAKPEEATTETLVEETPIEAAPGPTLTAIGGPTSEEAAVEMATETKHLPTKHNQKTHGGTLFSSGQKADQLMINKLSKTNKKFNSFLKDNGRALTSTLVELGLDTKGGFDGWTFTKPGMISTLTHEHGITRDEAKRALDDFAGIFKSTTEAMSEEKSGVEKMHEEGVCPHCGIEMKDGKCSKCGYSQEVMIQASFAAEIIPDLEPEMKSLLVENSDKFVDLDALIAKAKKGNGMSTADPGLFTRCVEKNKNRKGLTDVNSYCASVHQKITGMWPGEHGGKNKTGPEKSRVEVVVEEVIKALQK